MPEEFKLSGNGEGDAEDVPESQEQLKTALKNLDDLTRKDGSLVTMTKQDLSLLKQLVHAPDKNIDDFIQISLICDFLDEDEANRELEAFYEAQRLGMDTKYNVAHALSRCSINRRGGHSNSRVAQILDTLHHQKFTQMGSKGKNDRYISPRSPIA